eukprot:668977-Hanusia_phi.AAC.1
MGGEPLREVPCRPFSGHAEAPGPARGSEPRTESLSHCARRCCVRYAAAPAAADATAAATVNGRRVAPVHKDVAKRSRQ